MRFIRMLFSGRMLFHLLFASLFFIGASWLALWYLDKYTLHGQSTQVPDLIGFIEIEVEEILEQRGLKYQIMDSLYRDNVPRGIVLEQHPEAGSAVKDGRIIYLTINKMRPENAFMPNIVDKSKRAAIETLKSAGLEVGLLSYRPDQCFDCVLLQQLKGENVEPGAEIPKGTEIDLVLGGGLSDDKILVPLVINMTREEAMKELWESYLNIGAEFYDESVLNADDSMAARIYKQSPSYSIDSWLRMGSSVDVEYTIDEGKIDTNITLLDSTAIGAFMNLENE